MQANTKNEQEENQNNIKNAAKMPKMKLSLNNLFNVKSILSR